MARLKCNGIFNNDYVANLQINLAVKKLWIMGKNNLNRGWDI